MCYLRTTIASSQPVCPLLLHLRDTPGIDRQWNARHYEPSIGYIYVCSISHTSTSCLQVRYEVAKLSVARAGHEVSTNHIPDVMVLVAIAVYIVIIRNV